MRRLLSAVTRAAPAHVPAPALAPADAFVLDMLLKNCKWREGDGPAASSSSRLRKAFELRDVPTAARFELQARDLCLRLEREGAGAAPLAVTRAPDSAVVELCVARPPGSDLTLTQREVEVALAADDVAAALQLGGKWN